MRQGAKKGYQAAMEHRAVTDVLEEVLVPVEWEYAIIDGTAESHCGNPFYASSVCFDVSIQG